MPNRTPRARIGEARRFIDQAVASATDDCIPWPYGIGSGGYGLLKQGAKMVPAHRLTLELSKGGPPSPEMVAAHAPQACHNRACVNPRHLRWATQAENNRDRQADGTQAHNKGELAGPAKLTDAQVVAIRADGRPHSAIATEYGVAQSTISRIKGRQRWRHI